MEQDRLFSLKYLRILLIQITTVTYRPLINSILTSISGALKKTLAKLQGWYGMLQNFKKISNMANPKLKNNPAVFPQALKNVLKSNKSSSTYRI